jgi:hypothetical protein
LYESSEGVCFAGDIERRVEVGGFILFDGFEDIFEVIKILFSLLFGWCVASDE